MILKFLFKLILNLLIINLFNQVSSNNINNEKVKNNNIKIKIHLNGGDDQMNYYDYTKEYHGKTYIPKFVNQDQDFGDRPVYNQASYKYAESYPSISINLNDDNNAYNQPIGRNQYQQNPINQKNVNIYTENAFSRQSNRWAHMPNYKKSRFNKEFYRNGYINNDRIIKDFIENSSTTSTTRIPNLVQNDLDEIEDDDEVDQDAQKISNNPPSPSITTTTNAILTTTSKSTSTLSTTTKIRNLALSTSGLSSSKNRRRKPANKNADDLSLLKSSLVKSTETNRYI